MITSAPIRVNREFNSAVRPTNTHVEERTSRTKPAFLNWADTKNVFKAHGRNSRPGQVRCRGRELLRFAGLRSAG